VNLSEVVSKLVGPVRAVGDSVEDEKRLANLAALIELVEVLMLELHCAASDADRPEHSMRLIGERARDFLRSVENPSGKVEIS
jgi:hypothetical protein